MLKLVTVDSGDCHESVRSRTDDVRYSASAFLRADAHDPSMPHHEWFNKQEMNPAAQRRLDLAYKSGCDNADVFKTRFRVGEDRSDQWQYLKDGEWKIIPPDIIKESRTRDRTPVLFINRSTGQELCFFVPQGGL
jgi:hypothetical protein